MFSPRPHSLASGFVRPILVLICCTASAFSQSQITGRLAGTITDEKGAVITGAQVVAVNRTTNDERLVVTDATGNYYLSLLLPGAYHFTVKADGFNSAVFDSVQVVITETTMINVKLTVADIKVDPINVRTGSLSQSDGPQLGRVLNARALSELPLATRNFTQILALSPGTSAVLPDNTALGRNSLNVSVNGSRVTQNNFQLNGVDANNIGTNAAGLLAVPAPETIQEFTVQTSLYDATFGRGGGGSVQAVTRTGNNEFHGTAYEYFRDDSLNANNPFLKAAGVKRPTLSRNVFGGTFGGPIRKDRSFFFLSYQRTQERNGAAPNSLSSSIFIAPGLTDDRSQQTLLATFRPRLPNGTLATAINPVTLALLNASLPDGQFVIPTPQAEWSLFRFSDFHVSRESIQRECGSSN